MVGLLAVGLVDPRGGWERWWAGWPVHEPFGRRRVGGVENDPARGVGLFGVAVVDGRGGEQPDPGVAMGVVVPVE